MQVLQVARKEFELHTTVAVLTRPSLRSCITRRVRRLYQEIGASLGKEKRLALGRCGITLNLIFFIEAIFAVNV